MCTSRDRRSKTVVIIQARTGSTRLSNKVMHIIKGKTVLEHVIGRMQQCKNIDNIIVATTVQRRDLAIVKLCAEQGISVYCGSENDVLDRYYQAARLFEADHIVRITADCPMHDYRMVERVVEEHLKSRADYTSNTAGETFPDGLDTEVFRFEALEEAWEKACLASDREHATQYMIRCEEMTKHFIKSETDYKSERWTIDEPEDEEFIRAIFDRLYDMDPYFGMEQVLEVEQKEPELKKINANLCRNEGLLKSLENDRYIK